MPALEEEFEFLEKQIGSIRTKLPMRQKIELYGLWCVATRGKCTVKQPSKLNLLAYGKYQAWKKVDHLSKEEAMAQFVAKARPLVAKKARL
eukprot:gene7288-5131_t